MSWLPPQYDFAIAASAAGWLTGDLGNLTDDVAAAAIVFALLDSNFDRRVILAAIVGVLAGVSFKAVTA
jgi:hypothetical protein